MKMSKARFVCIAIFLAFLISVPAFSQSSNEITLEQEIENLNSQLEKTQALEKRIQLLEQIARAQEFSNMFPEAEESYFSCAELAGADRKVSYILKAVRCSLSYGNTVRADELLAKIANGARSNEYTPIFKLYAIWSWLSKCTSYDETYEPIAILKSYLELDYMASVRPQMLFTLWFITGQIQYAARLKAEYPQSTEYAIVCGRAELAPSPFWFFASRKLGNLAELAELTKDSKFQVASTKTSTVVSAPKAPVYEVNPDSGRSAGSYPQSTASSSPSKTQNTRSSDSVQQSAKASSSSSSAIIKYYQMGFFSKPENAQDLIRRAKAKNINAEIKEEVRSSGTTYYVVIVHSSDEKLGTIIKNSGFECYPVY